MIDSSIIDASGKGTEIGMWINVPGIVTINNSTIMGNKQALMVRCGIANVTNSKLILTGTSENLNVDLKRIKLNSIFMNCIVTNNYEFLINENKGSIDAKTIKNIAIVLLNITSYCIIHNKNGNEFANILLNFYDIDNNVSFDIINSFNNNIILLKLNYIIDKLNKKDNK